MSTRGYFVAAGLAVALTGAGLLAGCSAPQQAAVSSAETQVTQAVAGAASDVQAAVGLYGIAKGLVPAAEIADPRLIPVLAPLVAHGDGIVAGAQAAVNAATLDAPAVEALVNQLIAQANTIMVAAAPAIAVVPGK